MTEKEMLDARPEMVVALNMAYAVGTLAAKGFKCGQLVRSSPFGDVVLLEPTPVGKKPMAGNRTQLVGQVVSVGLRWHRDLLHESELQLRPPFEQATIRLRIKLGPSGYFYGRAVLSKLSLAKNRLPGYLLGGGLQSLESSRVRLYVRMARPNDGREIPVLFLRPYRTKKEKKRK